MPTEFLHKGSYTMTGNFATDSIKTISFTSVNTSSYIIVGSLYGSSTTSPGYSSQNDMIWTTFNRTSSSFKLGLREVSGNTGTLYFKYYLLKS